MRIKLLVINILKLDGHCAQIRFTRILRKENFLADAITDLGHYYGTQVWKKILSQ